MKDLGGASYVLGIQIIHGRANGILRLSQRTYIDRILKRFNMYSCSRGKALIAKVDKFSKAQSLQNDKEKDETKVVSYASLVGSLMYTQVCTRLDIAFVVGVLGRYLSDPGLSHWKIIKKVMRYL